MKEDILEQLVEDWFVSKTGWFVKHNIKYRPSSKHPCYRSKQDSVHSDIDILAISPIETGINRVAVVTCKSWQEGVKVSDWRRILEKEPIYNVPTTKFVPKEQWKTFRELASEKWVSAFIDKIQEETGQRDFQYFIAVTKLRDKDAERIDIGESQIIKDRFKKYNSKIEVKVITFEQILNEIQCRLKEKKTPSLEATDVGRLLQLMAAAEINLTKCTKEHQRKRAVNRPEAVGY